MDAGRVLVDGHYTVVIEDCYFEGQEKSTVQRSKTSKGLRIKIGKLIMVVYFI